MKKIFRFAISCLAIVLAFNVTFSCAAARYYTYAVNESFNSAKTEFLTPGDIDADGKLNADDLIQTKKFLLTNQSNTYADANGDGDFDILDLIRSKKNTFDMFVENGVMNLNGKSIFKGEFVSKLNTGVSYQLNCKYKSDSDVLVKIRGIGEDKEITLSSTSGAYLDFTNEFTTPFVINGTEEIELEVIGIATIDTFEVKQLNADNEYNIG